jgi:uncharacterized SAM-binding protein YcdF (DUF218 family)
MPDPLQPLRRGPWRYLRDTDVLHALAVTLLVAACSGGLVFIGYLVHVWRTAVRAPLLPPRRGVVLVFGQRLVDGAPGRDYRQRLRRGLAMARTGLAERLLLLGGVSGGRISEAAAGAAWLQAQGFPSDVPLVLEQASIDSLENLRQARSLLRTASADATSPEPIAAILVTSRYHLARCMLLARYLGFAGTAVGAEERLPLHWRYLARMTAEAGYLMWIDIGVRWARLIGHTRMAARIS